MSGIYIPGMEMPKDCPMCPLAHWDFTGEFRGCKIVYGKKYAMETEPGYPETNFRPSWCPLIPVPDHGRLIDKDVMCKECRSVAEEYDGIYPDCTYCPANLAPTIIPAKEET